MSRKLRDNLPTTESLLKPRVAEHAYVRLRERQGKAKAYFDRGTKKLSKLDRGDTVRIKSGRTWTPATVTAHHITSPRSYMVTIASGRVYRRNRKWLHKSSEPPPLTLLEDAGDDHTDKQYEQHGAPPLHNPKLCNQECQLSVRLLTDQTMGGPKRRCLYENRADRNSEVNISRERYKSLNIDSGL